MPISLMSMLSLARKRNPQLPLSCVCGGRVSCFGQLHPRVLARRLAAAIVPRATTIFYWLAKEKILCLSPVFSPPSFFPGVPSLRSVRPTRKPRTVWRLHAFAVVVTHIRAFSRACADRQVGFYSLCSRLYFSQFFAPHVGGS